MRFHMVSRIVGGVVAVGVTFAVATAIAAGPEDESAGEYVEVRSADAQPKVTDVVMRYVNINGAMELQVDPHGGGTSCDSASQGDGDYHGDEEFDIANEARVQLTDVYLYAVANPCDPSGSTVFLQDGLLKEEDGRTLVSSKVPEFLRESSATRYVDAPSHTQIAETQSAWTEMEWFEEYPLMAEIERLSGDLTITVCADEMPVSEIRQVETELQGAVNEIYANGFDPEAFEIEKPRSERLADFVMPRVTLTVEPADHAVVAAVGDDVDAPTEG